MSLIVPPDGESDTLFGASLSLSDAGTLLAVGAPGKDASTGKAYTYSSDGGASWSLVAGLVGSHVGDQFGSAVALSASGTLLAVGAPNASAAGIANPGLVSVFVLSGGSLVQALSSIVAPNAFQCATFGSSLAFSPDEQKLAISAPNDTSAARGINGNETDHSARQAGAVYIFGREATGQWTLEFFLKTNFTVPYMLFGSGVGFSGNVLAAGAPGESSNATGLNGDAAAIDGFHDQTGATYLFRPFLVPIEEGVVPSDASILSSTELTATTFVAGDVFSKQNNSLSVSGTAKLTINGTLLNDLGTISVAANASLVVLNDVLLGPGHLMVQQNASVAVTGYAVLGGALTLTLNSEVNGSTTVVVLTYGQLVYGTAFATINVVAAAGAVCTNITHQSLYGPTALSLVVSTEGQCQTNPLGVGDSSPGVRLGLIIGLTVGLVVLGFFVALFFVWFCNRRDRNNQRRWDRLRKAQATEAAVVSVAVFVMWRFLLDSSTTVYDLVFCFLFL